jgi:hypothetical protein
MSFQLEILQKSAAMPSSFTSRFSFSANTNEHGQVAQVAKRAKRNQSRVHLLANDGEHYGFVAFSLSSVLGQIPALVVDYLFVSLPYRKVVFEELGGLKIADYLLAHSFNSAIQISEVAPVRYIALLPADEALDTYYKRRGFKKLDASDWLFLKM